MEVGVWKIGGRGYGSRGTADSLYLPSQKRARRRGPGGGGGGGGGGVRRGSVADRDRWGRDVGGGRIGDRIGK